MKKSLFTLITLIFALATSCKPSAPLLPNVSGKAGEVLCVIEKADWDGALGQAIHDVLEDEYPFLPVKEYRYTVTHVTHAGFETDMFKVHRNIVFFDLHPQNNYPGVQILQNKWAKPQCVLLVRARSAEQADSVLRTDSEMVVSAIEQAERNRVDSILKQQFDLLRELTDKTNQWQLGVERMIGRIEGKVNGK